MNEENLDLSLLNGTNVPFLEQMYDHFLADPNSVEPTWQRWFQRLGDGVSTVSGGADDRGPSWARPDWPIVENPYDDTPVAAAENEFVAERCFVEVSANVVGAGGMSCKRFPNRIRRFEFRPCKGRKPMAKGYCLRQFDLPSRIKFQVNCRK